VMKRKSEYCGDCGSKFTDIGYWPRWTRSLVDEGCFWRFVCQRCCDKRDDDDTQGAQT